MEWWGVEWWRRGRMEERRNGVGSEASCCRQSRLVLETVTKQRECLPRTRSEVRDITPSLQYSNTPFLHC